MYPSHARLDTTSWYLTHGIYELDTNSWYLRVRYHELPIEKNKRYNELTQL